MQREAFYRAVGQAFQDGEAAQDNFAYAAGRWGDEKAIDILQNQTGRIGQLRGSLFSADGCLRGDKQGETRRQSG